MIVENEGEAKLPVQQLAILAICRLAEPIALQGVNPYLPEMIESFNVPKDKIATWVGITSASFSLAQCFTSFLWRRLSDTWGRKLTVLFCLTCAMTSTLFFGFSTSLIWAIVARCISGASNGNVGTVRTMVAELVPQKSLQPRAFSIMPLVWNVGSSIGPIIGGALASPARKYPATFGGSVFFVRFPFVLPNIVAACVFMCGIAIGFLFLQETLDTKKGKVDRGLRLSNFVMRKFSRKIIKASWVDGEETSSPLLKAIDDNHDSEKAQIHVGWREIFTFQSSVNLVAYAFISFHSLAFDQLLAVFLHLPEQDHSAENPEVRLPWKFAGGFAMDSGQIGLLFTIYGISNMTTQLILYAPVARRYGILYCFRFCTTSYPLVYLFTPFCVLLPTPATRTAGVLACMMLKGFSDVFAYPCTTIMLTNSANSIPVLGAVNAVAVSVASLARAAGPYTAGSIFSFGLSRGRIIIAWWCLAAIAVCGHLWTWPLKEMEGPSVGASGVRVPKVVEEGNEEEEFELLDKSADVGASRSTSLEYPALNGSLHATNSTHGGLERVPIAMMGGVSVAAGAGAGEELYATAATGFENEEVARGPVRLRSPLLR